MIQDMQLRGLAANTQRAYVDRIAQFARHFGSSPRDLGPEHIRSYQLHLIHERNASSSQISQFVAAVRLLYGTTLKKGWIIEAASYPRRRKSLPIVLSDDEVRRLLAAPTNLKHRCLLATMYSAGLRVSETCALHVSDVDSKRKVIQVRQGKGKKDRYVMLANMLLTMLRDYWQQRRPDKLLFPGRDPTQPIRQRHVYRICRDAAVSAGLVKPVTPHTLRHTFATHLLNAGVNLPTIQALLGHQSLRTTARYLHITSDAVQNTMSPLDALHTEETVSNWPMS